jgi:ubiquinone/menaquinone biosynthesis C-methylase UbiE
MDSAEDASEYDAMDHAAVNAAFVDDLLAVFADMMRGDWNRIRPWWIRPEQSANHFLDLGAGTARIPIEIVRRAPHSHVTAVDAAESMLTLARAIVTEAGLSDRIELLVADAKSLPFDSETFPIVISNSIIHHIAEPRQVIAEAIRVTAPGGLLFHRDLARPRDEAQLSQLVATYAGDANAYQRKLFANSLRAALTLEEVQQLVARFGYSPDSVRLTTDRHWTWATRRP